MNEVKKEDLVKEVADLLSWRGAVVYWRTEAEQKLSLCETFNSNTEWNAKEESHAQEALAFLDHDLRTLKM